MIPHRFRFPTPPQAFHTHPHPPPTAYRAYGCSATVYLPVTDMAGAPYAYYRFLPPTTRPSITVYGPYCRLDTDNLLYSPSWPAPTFPPSTVPPAYKRPSAAAATLRHHTTTDIYGRLAHTDPAAMTPTLPWTPPSLLPLLPPLHCGSRGVVVPQHCHRTLPAYCSGRFLPACCAAAYIAPLARSPPAPPTSLPAGVRVRLPPPPLCRTNWPGLIADYTTFTPSRDNRLPATTCTHCGRIQFWTSLLFDLVPTGLPDGSLPHCWTEQLFE